MRAHGESDAYERARALEALGDHDDEVRTIRKSESIRYLSEFEGR